jgi:MOSC domain-containing protein YiiM
VLAVGGVRLQISSPRGPCTDISRRWNASWLLKRVIELRRTGWYLRVLRAGELAQDDEIRLVERPHAGWTIERLLRLRYTPPREPAELAQAAALTALAPEWRTLYDRLPSGETD